MKLRKVTVVLLLLALCLSLASCGSNDGLSIACVGYVKGEAGSVQNEKNGEERYILPAEFVRSFAVYTASEKGALSLETGAQVLYSYDKIYMKTLVESASGEPQAFLSKMNEVATLAGTSLRFGSMTGLRDSEEELFEYMGKGCAFTESTGTLEDLKRRQSCFWKKGYSVGCSRPMNGRSEVNLFPEAPRCSNPRANGILKTVGFIFPGRQSEGRKMPLSLWRLWRKGGESLLLWWRNRAERTIPPILRRWMPEIFAAVCSE